MTAKAEFRPLLGTERPGILELHSLRLRRPVAGARLAVPAYSMPPNREDLVIQRILVRHGFTREMADQLLLEMLSALDHFAQLPPETLALAGAAPNSHDHSGR